MGAGPGLGNHIAQVFGRNGFRMVLMARREEKLKEYAADKVAGLFYQLYTDQSAVELTY